MRFTKYNTIKGSGSSTSNGATVAVSSSNSPSVDLSGVYQMIDENNTKIAQQAAQINSLNAIVGGLESKYLRKDRSDSTDHILTIGAARSDSFVSCRYDTTGVGYALTETGTASNSPNYALILSGLGNGCSQISCKSVMLDEMIMNSETIYNQVIKLSCSNCFSINNSTQGAYVLLDAGYSCGNHYSILEESLYMNYTQEMQPAGIAPVDPPEQIDYNFGAEMEKQGSYWRVPLVSNGRNTNYNFTYIVKYNYLAPNQQVVPMQAINLYIRGTNDTTTDYYGGVANKLVATPDYLQLTTNGAGLRITSQGIYRLAAGGELTQLL